ncbi:ester cyclase [Azospirillum sp. ST 5-10]|uniref:ester cyclase n=1 Tax=unclassified Azospirillum TaxID=2630922 RepID=UPI003F4A6019
MTKAHETDVVGLTIEERTAVETFYRAFEGRPELLDRAVAEDWQDIPLAPQQPPGREGMKPLIDGFNAAFPDTKVTVHEIIGAAGRVAVRASLSATHRGEWLGVAPTGRSFDIPIHEFHRITDGKLTHTWHLEDWLGWFVQVGAWPPAGGPENAS